MFSYTDSTSLICRALVCGNLEEAVELCLEAKRTADALIIASLGNYFIQFLRNFYFLNYLNKLVVGIVTLMLLIVCCFGK